METGKSYCTLTYFLTPNTRADHPEGYHGVFVSNGTTDLDALAARIAGELGLSASTVKLVLRTVWSKAADIISTRLCRVSVGSATFEVRIGGSLDSANAPLGEGNDIYVDIRLSESVSKVAAGITPQRVDVDSVKAQMDTVADAETEKEGQISSTGAFLVTGWALSATGDGEGVFVQDKAGHRHATEVEESQHGQRIMARPVDTIPSGAAHVLLTTHGLFTPDADIHTLSRRVTVLAGEAPAPTEPTLTEAWTQEHTEEGDKDKAYGDGDLEVIGTNLQGASVNMRFEGISGAPYDEAVPADKLTIRADGTGFEVDGAWLVANVLAVMNSDDTFQIHVETSAGTADLLVTSKYVG